MQVLGSQRGGAVRLAASEAEQGAVFGARDLVLRFAVPDFDFKQSRPLQLRPNGDGSKNLLLALPNPVKRPDPPPPKPPELPRIVRVLELARRWQSIFDRGERRQSTDNASKTRKSSNTFAQPLSQYR